jgi:hypothetical protein
VSATVQLPLLQSARIASPCPVRWEDLTPTGQSHTRHCDKCNLNVHNLSDMSGAEADALLRSALNEDGSKKHRLCAAIYRRADGTILTADCPVGLAAVRAKARRTIARAAAAVGLTTVVSWAAAREASRSAFARTQPLATVANYLRGGPVPPPISTGYVMGDIATPVSQPAPPVFNWLPGAKQ